MFSHAKTLKLLFVSTLVVALSLGGANLLLQLSQLESKIHFIVKDRVELLSSELKQKSTPQKLQNQFSFLALYDENGNILFSHKIKGYQELLTELQQYNHKLMRTTNKHIQESIIHNHIKNQFYFQFSRNIDTENFHGKVEGLYKIPQKDVDGVYKIIFYSIIQTVFTVLITALLLYPLIIYLNKVYIRKSKQLHKANLEILSVLGSAIAKRDSDTNAHNYRVTLYALHFGKSLKLSHKEITSLIKGSFLHDVGKIGIRDAILLKPDKLNDIEFEEMKRHVEFGVKIISQSSYLQEAQEIVAFHHEKYDGSGYLQGLQGEQIPLNARLFAICDVFDALTSQRPYKKAFSFEESLHIIKQSSGTHFDPKLVEHFCEIVELLYKEIAHIEEEEVLKGKLHSELHTMQLPLV